MPAILRIGADTGQFDVNDRTVAVGGRQDHLDVVLAVTGISTSQTPSFNLIISLHGLVAAIAMWLAFQPPAFYRRFIEGRARLDADAAPVPP